MLKSKDPKAKELQNAKQ